MGESVIRHCNILSKQRIQLNWIELFEPTKQRKNKKKKNLLLFFVSGGNFFNAGSNDRADSRHVGDDDHHASHVFSQSQRFLEKLFSRKRKFIQKTECRLAIWIFGSLGSRLAKPIKIEMSFSNCLDQDLDRGLNKNRDLSRL